MREGQKTAWKCSKTGAMRCVAQAVLCLAPCLVLTGAAQNPSAGVQNPLVWVEQRYPRLEAPGDESRQMDVDSPENERRLRAMNTERHRSLVADADKLLKLATELNAEVSSSDSDTLTVEQLRKVAEIQKLAKSVREKMATSVRSTSTVRSPFGMPPTE